MKKINKMAIIVRITLLKGTYIESNESHWSIGPRKKFVELCENAHVEWTIIQRMLTPF